MYKLSTTDYILKDCPLEIYPEIKDNLIKGFWEQYYQELEELILTLLSAGVPRDQINIHSTIDYEAYSINCTHTLRFTSSGYGGNMSLKYNWDYRGG